MEFVWRHAATIVVVLVLLTGWMTVFSMVRPRYQSPYTDKPEISQAGSFTTVDVMRAFAAQGLPLQYSARDTSGEGHFTWLGFTPPPWADDRFYVLLAPGSKSINWKAPRGGYTQRVKNLAVHYGGTDPYVLRAVEDATIALRG
jgi:hypothetical protein